MAKDKGKIQQPPQGLSLPHMASRVFGCPLLIEQGKLNTILEVLGPRMGFEAAGMDPSAFGYRSAEEHMASIQGGGTKIEYQDAGYYLVDNKLAIVPVMGTLVQRGSWMSSMSGITGYNDIAASFMAAMNDYRVKEIVLEIDSPGGEVAGAFDFADQIYSARGDKPITAMASEFAASAAYLIASAADEIVVPRTGSVGSIGVVSAHYDMSKAIDKKGIAVTYIYAGDKKVDGNQFQPLSESAQEDWQADVDSIYQLFVDTVARNRDMGSDRVRGTQAGMFMGRLAVDSGLADRVNTMSNELGNMLLRQQSGAFRLTSTRKEQDMSTPDKGKPAEATASADQLEAARREGEEAGRAGAQASAAEAGKLAKDRIKAIVGSEEAKGRDTLANHLAYETDMSAEDAKKALAASPAAAAGKGAPGAEFDKAMRSNQPGVRNEPAEDDKEGGAALRTKHSPTQVYAKRRKEAAAARASQK